MVTAQQTPWAVLLCKFRDDPTEPISPQLAQKLFTNLGDQTFNMTHFFRDVSHGSVDLSRSQVFGWFTVDVNVNDLIPPPGQQPKVDRDTVMALAKQTASNQGIPLGTFFGVVLVFNVAVGGSQGGSWGGIPPNVGVFSDYRYVQNNGSESYGQEMGHSYGLDHSRADDPQVNLLNCETDTLDYRDPWDGMSTACAYFFSSDPDFGARGPSFNGWNMRGRRWLDETRVWHDPGGLFDQVVALTSLLRHDLAGPLAAELPPNDGDEGHGRYLVEFRVKEGWDLGFPRSAVFVHRFEGPIGQFLGTHSYIMTGVNGKLDLVEGDGFRTLSTGGACLKVLNIDEQAQVATVRLNYTPLARVACATNLQNDLHICAIDGSDGLWHTMRLGDGSWPYRFGDVQAQTRQVGPNPGIGPTPRVACATNPQGDLHVLAIDMQNGLWHTIRKADGTWPYAFGDVQAQTRQVGPNPGIGPTPFTACATNQGGDLHVLAIDMQNGLWHTIRKADGTWPYAFGDVQAQTRQVGPNPGIGPTPFVACAIDQQDRLHVLALDLNNILWHTVRLADGTWPIAFEHVPSKVIGL